MFALIVTYTLLVVIVLLAIVIIIPQFSVLYDTVLDSRDYLTALDTVGKDLGEKGMVGQILFKVFDRLKSSIVDSLSEFSALLPKVVDALGSVVSQVSNLLLGVIISIYALADRRRLKAQAKRSRRHSSRKGRATESNVSRGNFTTMQSGFLGARAEFGRARRCVLLYPACDGRQVSLGALPHHRGLQLHAGLRRDDRLLHFGDRHSADRRAARALVLHRLRHCDPVRLHLPASAHHQQRGAPVARRHADLHPRRLFVGGLLGGLVAVPVYVTVRTLFLDYRKYRSGKVRTRNGV